MCEVVANGLGVDDQVSASKRYGDGAALEIVLPHDVLEPEESSRESVGDTHVH